MLIDRRQLGPSQSVECDVAIVGAGPAGITLALELARRGRQVVLVESGDRRMDSRIQNLGDADGFETQRHAPMSMAVSRRWGGTSTIWGGRCVPLDPCDFETRPARGSVTWPIAYEDMSRYYPQACRYALCGIAGFRVGTTFGTAAPPIAPGFADGDISASPLERWSLPTDFGAAYADEVRRSLKLRAYLGLTCIGLDFDGGPACLESIVARSLDGRQLIVRAHHFVIAAGGLESTRLLLNSDAIHPGGVGNHSELLGRYYMGHISGKIAQIQFAPPAEATIYGFERDAEGVYCRRRFVVNPTLQRQSGLLNCSMWLDNPPLPDAAHRNGILSLAYLALSTPWLSRLLAPEAIRRAAIEHPVRSPVWNHMSNIAADLPSTLAFVPSFLWRRYFARRKIPGFFLFSGSNRYALHYHGEQAPNIDSRVQLSDARDELGLRRLAIDLKYSDADVDSIIRTHALFDAYLRKLGIGHLHYVADDLASAVNRQARDGYHQIGTTRMSARPEQGVVDANCRVHSVRNLYVASSSVFPTSGQANPTLSVLALGLRLADHLDHKLNPSQVTACSESAGQN